jgi:RES domain-containing protein
LHEVFDPEWLDALEKRSIGAWSGEVWRATISDTAVLRANTQGARWNPPNVEALYTSLDEAVAMSEAKYHVSRHPVPISRPILTHKLRVELFRVIDLRARGVFEELGLKQTDLFADDQLASQRVGGAVSWLEYSGLLVPSARASGINLVVFVGNIADGEILEPLDKR